MNKVAYYSTNNEEYCFGDMYDAIEYLLSVVEGLKVGDEFVIWEGELVTHLASYYAPDVIDNMYDKAVDEMPEHAEDWLDVDSEVAQELQKSIESLIDSWADKHKVHPEFGHIKNEKQLIFVITEIDEFTSDIKYKEVK